METLEGISKLIKDLLIYESELSKVDNGRREINNLRAIQDMVKWAVSPEDELIVKEWVKSVISFFLSSSANKLVKRVIRETSSGENGHNKDFDYSLPTDWSKDVLGHYSKFHEIIRNNSTGDDSNAEKSINAWITGFETSQKLQVDKRYELLFRVGDSDFINLLSGDNLKIALAEIPESGLETEWRISSTEVKMGQYSIEDKIVVEKVESSIGWAAKFKLVIPKEGNSETVKLFIIPQKSGKVQLDVLLYTMHNIQSPIDGTIHLVKDLYRQFKINLEVGEAPPQTTGYSGLNNLVQNELIYSPASQLNLIPSHEWTTPPGELHLNIKGGGQVSISGDAGYETIDTDEQWTGVSALVSGPLENLLNSAERFRAKWNTYLNDLDDADINARLRNFGPQYDWGNLRFSADPVHEQNWQTVANSKELKDLAYDAYILYDVFFPAGSFLRSVVDKLIPGQKIKITWLPCEGYIPHVPWGLLYSKQPDGGPVDAGLFMGLRYRISYTARKIQNASKALGKHENSFSANLFYWDNNQPDDPVFKEAAWQQQQFAALQINKVFVPATTGNTAKTELVGMLNRPVSPLALMYLYCHCSVGDGKNNPVLRFGASSAPEFIISRTELGLAEFKDRPLVFANACSTATADPYSANELAEAFFRRQCRAYIGTEIKVPIVFASRFAFIFFNFFYRKVDPEPMAGGEAIAQTRLWLWANYRNIGGLFYNYVNQYELFMADDDEVKLLQKGHA